MIFHHDYLCPKLPACIMGFKSQEIKIGNLVLGGTQPVWIQSMTNTATMDTIATSDQIERLAHAGCQLVRVTAANLREADHLKNIRRHLDEKGICIPLIADVHFQPKAAEKAAEIVEKVRINPGNYTGSYHQGKKYADEDYRDELFQTAQNLRPLLQLCKRHGTALRIGINHGSLSDRILYRYGNTPQGMVASAMEFIRICRTEGFHKLTLSLKASHVETMIKANRLMVTEMEKRGWHYPLHLGVTEAGNGMSGRVKSVMGIGILLSEGIGDTLRVSLTEPPENEIPVARGLTELYGRKSYSLTSARTEKYNLLPENLKKNTVLFRKERQKHPEVIVLSYHGLTENALMLRAPVDFYHAFERFQAVSGLLIVSENSNTSPSFLKNLTLDILQAGGVYFSKTEIIACPSCGRSQFDIERLLEKVKNRLGHYKGLKIAVMGCAVNGPGEMAGADYGFVGAAPGKVHLYKHGKIVFKNLSENEALEKIENLIAGK